MNTMRPYMFWWFFLALSSVVLLAGCEGLPFLTRENVPRQAPVGIVPVSVELDPRQAQVQEVTFSYWQGNGVNSQRFALNCVAMNPGPRQLCEGNIPFNTAGVYSYSFGTSGRIFGDTTQVKTQTGRITITSAGTGNPPGGDNPPGAVELVAPVLLTPAPGQTCAGTLGGSQTTVFFDWEDVPGTVNEAGAYQIEIHRVSSNCQPVNWTRVNSGFDNFPNCWIADPNLSGHAENLDQNTQYEWRVRASQIDGNGGAISSGPFSEFRTFITAGPPTQPPTFVFPSEGQVIPLGGNTSSASIRAEWSQASCRPPETFTLELFPAGASSPVWVGSGTGHVAEVPVRNNQQFELRLRQQTATGEAPPATLNFSTAP